MTTGSDKPSIEEREKAFHYKYDDAAVAPTQRLAIALRERYSVERLVGRGGAAYVYLARDIHDDRVVALKVLRPEFSAAIGEARFHREIEIARHLHHPNILPLLDFGTVDGLIYFTMPFVEGDTLRARLRTEKQLALREALSIARDVAGALDYAHEQGVLHRDIKPPNILLDNGKPLVADFGVARAMKVASGEEITTHSGLAIGTPEYMSPEQGSGERDLDARADIYALGCVLYEMLAGEPPFTGPTAQAIIARHCLQPPQSIRVIRPDIPIGIEQAIGKALAKVPADRFSTGAEFVEALDEGIRPVPPRIFPVISRRMLAAAAAIAVVAATAAGTWYAIRPTTPTLDTNRVVVFPLYDQAATASANGGEAVGTYVGYALDGTRPLKWLDGWELLDATHRSAPGRLDQREERKLSRAAGAAFFIDGSILRRRDSITVVLRLFSLADDSIVRVAGRSAPSPSGSAPQLGVAAVADLLPSLVAPGGRIDVNELSQRNPVAVANFLQGEREYRRMQFELALQHYQAALSADSAFTLAASRGAYAANWLSDFAAGNELAETALRHPQSLSASQVLLIRGLRAYLSGAADSAVQLLRLAIARDSTIHAGWTLLGEVYTRLLPNVSAADSLARDALSRARRADPDFAPTLLLLEESALRDGNIRDAELLRNELKRAGADTTHKLSRGMMLRCVRDGPASVDWNSALEQDEMAVLSTAKILSARAAQPSCAIAIFRTLINADSVSRNARWQAFSGLLSQLTAVNRAGDARKEFASERLADLPLKLAYLMVAGAGGGFDREATAAADSLAANYDKASAPGLWYAATWEAKRKNVLRVRQIAQSLNRKVDSTRSRRDSLLREAVTARLQLLEGDSLAALRMLQSLSPSAPRAQIAWSPWESLGPERMQLAELLFARGRLKEALGIASQLDAAEPLTYPLYLRQSLLLRLRIAEAMNDPKMSMIYRRRLTDLIWNG
jgi:tRNA A-37 threonylcarbamoyl transferase component Bud32